MNSRLILGSLLAAAAFAAGQQPEEAPVAPGKERWPIKTSLAANADPANAVYLPLPDFLALGSAEGVGNNDKRYQSALIPRAADAKFAEGDIVKTRGYLRLVAGEPDGDYHIQISDTPDSMDNCLVVEVPNPGEEFVTDTALAARLKPVREFIDTKLLRTGDAQGRTRIMQHAVYVEVTGQLFFDDAHVAQTAKGQYRGKSIHGTQLPSKTVWEIHPVIDMQFAPKPAAAAPRKRPAT